MTDFDTIWRTQDEIRTVVNAVRFLQIARNYSTRLPYATSETASLQIVESVKLCVPDSHRLTSVSVLPRR